MLFERKRQYAKKGIRRARRSTGRLVAAAKFIAWFEYNEIEGDDFDEVDNIIGDPIYVPII